MHVELREIRKYFGPVRANDGISLLLEPGHIYGLLGENGAGKSTLMKILSGYQAPSSGQVLLEGQPAAFSSPSDALSRGIGMLYQEPQDFPPLQVLENHLLAYDNRFRLDLRGGAHTLRSYADRFGFVIDPRVEVSTLTLGERQQMELMRLLSLGAEILILDEPTTGISAEQKEKLFTTMHRLAREEAKTIVLVSHKLDEVQELCDQVAVLRRGILVGTQALPCSNRDLVRMMFDIDLVPSEQRAISSVVLAQWLREELGQLEGVRELSIDAVAGPPGSALEVQFTGNNLESLRLAAKELKQSLTLMEGVQDVSDSFNAGGKELDIHVTPQGEALGLGDVDLARQVRQAFFGAEVQRVQRGRDEVRVYVRLPAGERAQLGSLQSLWIRLPDGRKVPFPVVGEAREKTGLSVIDRIDRKRVVFVRADVNKRVVEPGEVTDLLQAEILPEILQRHPGITYSFGGEAEAEEKTSEALTYGFIIILIMIYGALAIPLKSYLEPTLIMSVIPFGIIGAIIGHLLLGKDISILSVIGIIGLVGVVVNDSLVMVDFINHYIDEGHDWRSAILEAGPKRFRPVILTSVTTFLGLLPIQMETSIQSEFVKPMAISVAFGVLFATFVTLILVPVLYHIARDLEALTREKSSPAVSESTATT